jgi:hypothetical protein
MSMVMQNLGATGITTGSQATIYVQPPGTVLVPGPLHFGLPGDSNAPSAIPQAHIHPFQPCANDSEANGCRPVNGKDIPYRPAYVKQVGENYGLVGRVDSRSIQFMGPYQNMHWTELGRGPKTTPQFNLLQPIPYWNVWAVSPQALAAWESLTGQVVTQVPASYTAAGPPNLYLGA